MFRGTDEPGARCAKVRGGHRLPNRRFSAGQGSGTGSARGAMSSLLDPVTRRRAARRATCQDGSWGLTARPLNEPSDHGFDSRAPDRDPDHDVRHTRLGGGRGREATGEGSGSWDVRRDCRNAAQASDEGGRGGGHSGEARRGREKRRGQAGQARQARQGRLAGRPGKQGRAGKQDSQASLRCRQAGLDRAGLGLAGLGWVGLVGPAGRASWAGQAGAGERVCECPADLGSAGHFPRGWPFSPGLLLLPGVLSVLSGLPCLPGGPWT